METNRYILLVIEIIWSLSA